ncbi:MAG: AvrD family protein [Streptosporangiaceae bacterium]|jgi:hypothetical protein
MTQAQLAYRSIDDYLGPGENRFFARGYRRAEYQVTDVIVTPPGDPGRSGTRASVTIGYPADWSTKADNVDLRPHLSTVDMLVLGVQLSEAHLAHAYGLDHRQRQGMWLRKVTLRAGSAPQEELTGLTGSATLRGTRALPGPAGAFVSSYDCTIGAMQARCEIEHPIAGRAVSERAYASIEDALGPAARRYYGDGFKTRQHRIDDVRLDLATLRAAATVPIGPVGADVPLPDGIEGNYQPSVSMIDCFVVNLQLVQVLLYELDSIPRQQSNTLWMVKTVLEAAQPHRPYAAAMDTEAAITGKHLLPLRGGTWRNADITGACGGITLRASFAHELPAPARPAGNGQSAHPNGGTTR